MQRIKLNSMYGIRCFLWDELSKQISLLMLTEDSEENERALIIIKYLKKAIDEVELKKKMEELNK